MELLVPAPSRFNFHRTVLSHGWAWLPPFEVDAETNVLRRVVTLPGRRPVVVAFTAVPRAVRVVAEPARLSARAVAELSRMTSVMFGLDVDLDDFYRVASKLGWRWIGRSGAGRLLRAPTVFEDLVKLLLSTNSAWDATSKMVTAMMQLGEPAPGSRRAFPTPTAVAEAGEPFLRNEARFGSRAPVVAALAAAEEAGTIDLEAWRDLPPGEVRSRASTVKGMSGTVVDSLLRMWGRPGGLALDRRVRAALSEREGREMTDADIEGVYRAFGEHAALALWCEVSRDWTDGRVFFA